MSQPALPPIPATSRRLPLNDPRLVAPAAGPKAAQAGKRARPETDGTVEPQAALDHPLLLAQASGTPNNPTPGAANLAAAESCPINEPGVSDVCGFAGAADAHPAAGGAVWLAGLLPLLALCGGGGGGGGAPGPGPTTIYPAPPQTPPGTVPGSTNINAPLNVLHPIDSAGDNGQKLADFNSNQANAVFRVVKVTDAGTGAPLPGRAAEGAGPYDAKNYPGTNPATDPLFYLNKNTGEVFLTEAGAAAQCIGRSYTITVEAVANGIVSAQGEMTFTLAPPVAETGLNHGGTTLADSSKTAPNSYDVLKIDSAITEFHVFMVGTKLHIQTQPSDTPSTTAVSEIDNHLLTNPLEYVSFNNLTYHDYSFGETAAYTNYFKVITSLGEQTLPTSSSLTGSGLVGTDCNDLLFNDGSFSIEKFFGGDGNDLIFVGADDGKSYNPLVLYADGGNGNDLLVGSSGADRLFGGLGNDVLIGGTGNDIFAFNAPAGTANADVIHDFTGGEDKIQLDKAVFGADALTGNHIAYNAGTGVLSYDGAIFATLANKPLLALDQTNFIVA